MDTLESLGLEVAFVKKIPAGGTSRRCIVFPSVQGLIFLLNSKLLRSAEVDSHEEV